MQRHLPAVCCTASEAKLWRTPHALPAAAPHPRGMCTHRPCRSGPRRTRCHSIRSSPVAARGLGVQLSRGATVERAQCVNAAGCSGQLQGGAQRGGLQAWRQQAGGGSHRVGELAHTLLIAVDLACSRGREGVPYGYTTHPTLAAAAACGAACNDSWTKAAPGHCLQAAAG